MTDIRDFITDRLHEDQTTADGALAECGDDWDTVQIGTHETVQIRSFVARFNPERVRLAASAQFVLLADHEPDYSDQVCCRCTPNYLDDYATTAGYIWPCLTLRALAATWQDHPDYDEAWIVDMADS